MQELNGALKRGGWTNIHAIFYGEFSKKTMFENNMDNIEDQVEKGDDRNMKR